MSRISKQLEKLKTAEEVADNKNLTAKEKLFCYQYVIDRNVSRAAERANITRRGAQMMIKRERVLEFIEHLDMRDYMSSLENEPKMLKGQRTIWANSNMADYFKIGSNGLPDFVGFQNLTRAQSSCIKKFKVKPNEFGVEVVMELYDADRSNEVLARPHGLYEQIKIDLSLLDMLDPKDIEKLSKKYGWGDLEK